ARQAARDVLRYFDVAAPLHHEDEELHVFPPLLERGTADVVAAVRQLQQDHEAMSANWQAARALLLALAEGRRTAFDAADEAVLARFASIYAAHICLEEDRVYPAARALLAPGVVQAMGAEMRRRRGAAG
ncbi:MAG: hemerythrin domain-containing protein, partial [Giesbergeria sp.]|nr:hemerythrin domain-containing protein [Giesbergeria sp.]